MDFLRRHVFFIVCGVGSIGGIAMGVMGMQRMPSVLEEMRKVEGVYGSLNNLTSTGVNRARLDAEDRRIERVVEDHDAVFDKARAVYGYEPLVPDLFPKCEPERLIRFRTRYNAAMEDLLASLKYGRPANRANFAEMEDRIEQEQAEERELRQEGRSSAFRESAGAATTVAGVLTKAGARNNAMARAHMAAAQRIYCYGVHFRDDRPPERVASLDIDPGLIDTGTVDAPFPEDVWRAQVGYWIQKDVVEAIVAINEAAAETIKKSGGTPWVGNLPVKDVISIRPSFEYIPADGDEVYGSQPGGYAAAVPPSTPLTVFTSSGQTDWYDVMQFAVKLVMDQRDIPLLIDLISKNSFHTLLRVTYEAVPANRKMIGKIYGSEPTVNVVMDFETVMIGELFRPLMPAAVCEYYEIQCPEPPTDDEG